MPPPADERLERQRLHPTVIACPRRRCLVGRERRVGGTMRDIDARDMVSAAACHCYAFTGLQGSARQGQ